MKDTTEIQDNKYYYYGIAWVAVSFLIYCVPLIWGVGTSSTFGLFFLNFTITALYFIYMWTSKRWQYMFVFLVLFLISAYSLNRDMTVFQKSAGWLTGVLIIYSVNYLALFFIDRLPTMLQRLMAFLLGGAIVLFVYLAVFLLPMYPFSLIGFFLLGIPLHTFVPVLLVIFSMRASIRLARGGNGLGWGIAAGAGVSVLIAVVFTVQWHSIDRSVSRDYRKTLIADNTDLPGWIKVSQHLPHNSVAEKYLKAGLVYTSVEHELFDWGWDMPAKNFGESRVHDPLIVVAGWMSPPIEIDMGDRIKILESAYGQRHQAEDRLWAGANLRTSSVITNVRIWPEERIAYTEKIINVTNSGQSGLWSREEAIYTFHLPEGGVVTSLSLWIDGKEQKGVLTSTHKADSAYKQIVGVEQHDPSLVHWREGNTVSVRVFPVLATQARTFKIGITAPLTSADKKLVYDNVWFQGPDFANAEETQQVDWVTEPARLQMPQGFRQNGAHRYLLETKKYDPDFRLEFADAGMHAHSFSFESTRYAVQPYAPVRRPATFGKVYLDINNAWTKQELQDVCELVKGRELYVYDGSMQRYDAGAQQGGGLQQTLLEQNFSLFPFFEIGDTATALVITKCPAASPNLYDLKGSDFAAKLEAKTGTGHRIRLFNIGNQLSPYLRTMKEHRAFDYEAGDLPLLRQLITGNTFAANAEDDDHMVIDNAGIMLVRSKDTVTAANNGPDHLMRLFAYNHIMSQLKSKQSDTGEQHTALVDEAEKAYIVTPVSSLIVLETQKDYDRFNIKKSKHSLDDATLKSNGAVPEPGEWALIIVAVLGLAWVLLRHRVHKTLPGA